LEFLFLIETDMAKRQKLKSGQNYLADIINHDYQQHCILQKSSKKIRSIFGGFC